MAESEKKRCTWLCGGIALAGIAGIFGSANLILKALQMVRDGRGLESYHTVWLVEFNYVGVLVLFAVVVLALLVSGALWVHDWWQWRTLRRKYGG